MKLYDGALSVFCAPIYVADPKVPHRKFVASNLKEDPDDGNIVLYPRSILTDMLSVANGRTPHNPT